MLYSTDITRERPTCFLFLVDQSGSMRLPFGRDPLTRKADGVADAINKLLHGLVLRTARGPDVFHDYFYIGVIGYGERIGSALGGALAGQGPVLVSQIARNPLRIEERLQKTPDGAGGVIEAKVKFPVWIEPLAKGKTTPMAEVLAEAQKSIRNFVDAFRNSFPPIVINITDGEATDRDPEPEAAALRTLATEHGNVLMFNVHISAVNVPPILFPSTEQHLPDRPSRRLFRMSSPLPPAMLEEARSLELPIEDGARGFVFNADLVSVIQFLNIGTRLKTST